MEFCFWMNSAKYIGLTMKTLLNVMVVAVAFGTAFGLVMRTKGISTLHNFRWIVEDLSDLPKEHSSNEFALDVIRGSLVLKTDIDRNLLEIYYLPIRDLGESFGSPVNLNGTVTFKNLMNHVYGERLIRGTLNLKEHLLTVDIFNVFGKNSLSEIFKMLDNVLVMDFSILLTKVQSISEN